MSPRTSPLKFFSQVFVIATRKAANTNTDELTSWKDVRNNECLINPIVNRHALTTKSKAKHYIHVNFASMYETGIISMLFRKWLLRPRIFKHF